LRCDEPPTPAAIRNLTLRLDLANLMIIHPSHPGTASAITRIGAQPIALTAAALLLVLAVVASIAAWRAYTGISPETDRAVAARALQAHTAQVSEQLVEKTKGLEATQQDSIDQLQTLQDQVQTLRRLLATQQADTKRLSDQVASLSDAVDSLRQSFASAQPSDPSPAPSRNRALRLRARAVHTAQKRSKSLTKAQ